MANLRVLAGAALLGICMLTGSAWADGLSLPVDPPPGKTMEDFNRDVFFFGGRFHREYFNQSFTPWTTEFENNYIIGGGAQQFFSRWRFVRFGAEVGLADRFNTDGSTKFGAATNSVELWAGLVTRFDGFDLGPVHLTPAMTFGFSAVTGLIGIEAERNSSRHSDNLSGGGKFLVYLGPELDLSVPSMNPNMEVFWRAQHRSGAFGTIADLDGANADVLGIRWKFQ